MPRYALGLDFGTESARALVVDAADGREAGESVAAYRHGVVEHRLPENGAPLPPSWALQDADDYLDALGRAVPAALARAGCDPQQVIGIGVDFTACTLVPARDDGTPLSRDPSLRARPHAWTKLWKHHGAAAQAERINALASARGEQFLRRYGGKTSSEWLFAKALELLEEAPELYERVGLLLDAGDWLIGQLTGEIARSACQAGYKALWSRSDGYPSRGFLAALHPGLAGIVETKLRGDVLPVGARAGRLTAAMAGRLGLRAGVPVGTAIIDAHAAVPAAGVAGPGALVMILGTSGCHMTLGREERDFAGICGVVQDGILPGYFGYEAGQAATGDILNWFVRHCVPGDADAAHERLTAAAARLPPGAGGLLALDWWNGNRSILMDETLSGVLVGLTLGTRPEQIYRALIEGTGFGTRIILENFEANGIEVRELIATGGIAARNPVLLQIYADITRRPIRVCGSAQACALGAAILGAAAAGAGEGGYDDIEEAVAAMSAPPIAAYEPSTSAAGTYDRLFAAWKALHDHFGRGGSDALRLLRELREA